MGKLTRFYATWDVVVFILLNAYSYLRNKYVLADNLMLFITIVIACGTMFWLVLTSKKFKPSNDKALVELIMIGLPALVLALIPYFIWPNSEIFKEPPIIFCLLLVVYEIFKFTYSLLTIKRSINLKRLITRLKVSSQQPKKKIYRKYNIKYRNYPDIFLQRRRSFYKYEIYFAGTFNLIVAIFGMCLDGLLPWMKTILIIYLIIFFLPIAFMTGKNMIKLQAVEDNLKKENVPSKKK